MAFFSGLSSSIGKKLLLYGLRHIDILDKDPADFVSVDVGKRTTLEVRDVGLHVKKLVALLHLKLPPEIHLSKARASLLRVTFVLDFGVPQISIEVDGIQLQARLVDHEKDVERAAPKLQKPRARSSTLRRSSSPPLSPDDLSDASDDDEYVPTVDELAKSFLKTEPTDEIRELEQELESRSEYLQESIASSDDGSDEGSAGMGAPLALPTYLRNILNTALDRLSIAVNNVDVEVEDQSQLESPNAAHASQNSPVSLKFRIKRIAIDSVSSQDDHVQTDEAIPQGASGNLGKRRLHIQSVCARLVSDAENFVSMSRLSQPVSPTTTRSDLSTSQGAASEVSARRGSMQSEEGASLGRESSVIAQHVDEPDAYMEATSSLIQAPVACDSEHTSTVETSLQYHAGPQLASSIHTVDDDRFADASSDDGFRDDHGERSVSQSRHDLPIGNLGGSSILYDDDGVLEYALQNDMLTSRFEDDLDDQFSHDATDAWGLEGASYSQDRPTSAPASEASISALPTVSALGRSFRPPSTSASLATSSISEGPDTSTDNLASAQQQVAGGLEDAHEVHSSPASSPGLDQDLAQSQLFTHDEAESMYMSAISAAQTESTHRPHIPGGWDSSSTSSRSTTSDNSGSVPEEMVTGSIIAPLPEVDDGCETPRPSSPQSMVSSPHLDLAQTPTALTSARKQSKTFLTIDEVVVWFPLGLEKEDGGEALAESTMTTSGLDFKPPNLGEDSIFAEMPGSFSNYAHASTHRRKPSMDASARKRPALRSQLVEPPDTLPKQKNSSTSISVEVGSVVAHMDLSTGRIMYGMLTRFLNAMGRESDTQQQKEKKEAETPITSASLEISVKSMGVAWLETIVAESLFEEDTTARMLALRPQNSIVRAALESVKLSSQSRSQDSRAKLQIGKFVLASLDQTVIAFHAARPRSRRSVSGLPEHLTNDIEIDYEQAKDIRITVVTRPLEAMLDIQKLDDALGSFGGFSGVLELSNSISSANIATSSPVMSPSRPRPRGVHFGDVPPATSEKTITSSSSPKLQVQFGEVAFTLKGKTCAVKLQTTSVRIAMRESNLRLKVSEIHLSGPYTDMTQLGAPLLVDIRGTTVNFLFAPEEVDLGRLISLITPSRDPYENDDDILIDTLLRQRRKGSVLRVEVSEVGIRISDLEQMNAFNALGAELARLSRVTKYLPDDDRPGVLSLISVKQLDAGLVVNKQIGDLSISLSSASLAHVGVPALLAAEIGRLTVTREDEVLIHDVIKMRTQDQLPAVMIRMVGDEMEPVVKTKLFNVCVEYRVSTIMAALGLSEDGTADQIALGIAASVATITGASSSPKPIRRQSSQASSPAMATAKPLQIDLLLRNCAIGLNPRKIPSKGLFVLTEAHLSAKQIKSDYSITVELRKASMHAIDDTSRVDEEREATMAIGAAAASRHLHELKELGFVSLSSISAAKVLVNITGDGKAQPQLVDIEFKNELFVLESCADSTATLTAILNGLQPPTPPSTAERYRTVVPLQQMMESFTGDAVVAPEEVDSDDFMSNADLIEDELPTNLEFVGSMYNSQSLPTDEEMGDSLLGEDDLGALATPPIVRHRGDRGLLESFQEKYEITDAEEGFDFNENYFKDPDTEDPKGKARKWDSTKNQYHLSNEFKQPEAPIKVRVRDVNIIWNLYDGYDWPRTRNIISQAVDDVEARAEERRRKARDDEEDDDFVEEDFLFNSVWIGVPVTDEQGALARRINHDIDDLASETGSYATSTATRSTGITVRPRSATKPKRRLKLERSKHKKIAFSLMGVAVDLVVFPPDSGETINSIDVRVRDFEIFDHVPTSTWKKFVTCLVEPSSRELNKPMINLDLLTVKPVTELAASELVIKVSVLPLRLHVDQDALDFITRFFEFKDDTALSTASASAADQPFIQRLEVKAVTLKLDYKPKRVDYRGLRSGHTTEFKNFLILDGSDIILRHAIVYGITSFDKLHQTLNDVWTPDVIRNQLPGVLSGLAAVRPLVNVGSGMRDLVVVPMREYKKDGRIVRSLQKGVYAFAKNTTSEVARLGAKVAIGTQTLLEGAEALLAPQTSSPNRATLHDDDAEPETSERAVSHYANQPLGVRAGLQSAARHLERDLLTARDAVIAIPAEVMEEGSGVGMARAIARHAPTVILRPAVGATKAVGNALLGVGNALDGGSRQKIEDKYKSY
ncbi:hypothetical protein EK21DRAFT_109311 [Setomelanomma holmii]|uniref:Autophagy-related protein 2 n=1 Tax=Setomelanomma holmii TaxID=210430 RepID=A0A9P4HER7_9PLEO|nr:hypothetical protein EK21DRAFT_109311 [Setomelanomma holmii]